MRQKLAAPQTLIAVVIAASLLVVIAILWMPFGWNVMGIQEEWHVKAALENPDLLGNAAAEVRSRPMEIPLVSIANTLSPDSFVGFNLLHAFFFFGKGIVLYALLRRLWRGSRIFAFLTAVLFVVYPADEGVMTTRATYIHAAALFYLAGAYCLVAYWQTSRWPWLIGMGLSLAISLGAYEAGYPLVFFTPLVLVWLEKRVTRRMVWVIALWYLVPGLFLLNLLLVFTQSGSMQGRLLEAGTSQRATGTLVGEMLNSLWIAYQRHFVIGWQVGLAELGVTPLYTGLAAAAALVVAAAAGIIGWLSKKTDAIIRVPTNQPVGTPFAELVRTASAASHDQTSPTLRQYALFIAAGLVIIALGILLYLPTSRRYVDWRVYFYSAAGAALVVGLLCWLIGRAALRRRGTLLFTVLMSVLIGVATLRLLHQHEKFVEQGLEEEYVLGAIIQQAPRLTDQVDMVLVAPPNDAGVGLGSFSNSGIAFYATSYLYQDYQHVRSVTFCLPGYSTCQFKSDSLTIQSLEQSRTISYDHMLVFESSAGGGIRLLDALPEYVLPTEGAPAGYNPSRLIDPTSPPPPRVYTTLRQWPVTYYPMISQDDFARFTQSPPARIPVITGLRDVPCVGLSDCDVRTWLSGMPQFDLTTVDDTAIQRLQTFIGNADTVWYVRTDMTNPAADTLLGQIRQDYAIAQEAPWNGQREPAMTIYRRRPDHLQDLFIFGDNLRLQAWSLQNDVQVKPCQTVSLESWWRANDRPAANFSMTLVLANAQGVGEARTDSPPANMLTGLWQPGLLYLDDRTLTIPCDLPSGDYSLLVGLYNSETVAALAVKTGAGAPVSGLAYLTTLTVTP